MNLEGLVPFVCITGKRFKTYTYIGVPPRVGDTITVTKDYFDRHWVGVVKSVSWLHSVSNGEQSVRVTVEVGDEKPGLLGNIAEQINKLNQSDRRPSFVYFISNPSAGMVKIGYSTDPGGRLAALQTSHHCRLEILFTMPGTEALESWLHQRFQSLREEGEWFRLEGDLKSYVDLMSNGNNYHANQ